MPNPLTWLKTVRSTRRGWQTVLVAVDAATIVLATIVTYFARFEGIIPHEYGRYLFPVLLVSVLVYVGAAAAFGLYKVVLRYVGIDTLLRALAAAAIGAAALVLGDIVIGLFRANLRYVPLGVILIQGVFVFIALSGVRIVVRAVQHVRVTSHHEGIRVLIIGAGSAGSLLLRDIRARGDYSLDVVGLLDDNPALKGALFGGEPVLGRISDLEKVAVNCDIEQVYVALPSAPWDYVRDILNRATDLGLTTRIMPKLVIQTGQVNISDLRKVDVEDLLGRELTPIDTAEIRGTIEGRRVVVTGAAGSIGSELCRQLVQMKPEKIYLFEIDESRLYELWFELEALCPGCSEMHIIDIRDNKKLQRLMGAIKPSVVLHAAAYKHVPLMELEPVEAVRSNVIGTSNVMTAAAAAGADRFVLISTDKAVAPINVMGKTKQLAERLMLAFAQAQTPMTCVAVRFGNVLGSRGSVVPIFEEKLARNEPLTVTDPEVTRFFMMIPEAARLVLQAQAIGNTGDIFLLEMGEPVKIVDLARKMIALSGVPADITFTGLRPGEKLHETLITETETLEPTTRPNILRVTNLTEAPLTQEAYAALAEAVRVETIDAANLLKL
jgi:FlaA1/EpsC-like NDP-sugar epimerase